MLYKLPATLCEYKPYEARYGDIIELIKYTYEHTPCRKCMDPLRELVTLYVAQEQVQIAGSKPCLALVEEGGPICEEFAFYGAGENENGEFLKRAISGPRTCPNAPASGYFPPLLDPQVVKPPHVVSSIGLNITVSQISKFPNILLQIWT